MLPDLEHRVFFTMSGLVWWKQGMASSADAVFNKLLLTSDRCRATALSSLSQPVVAARR
jgi:hypothetical protein